tara:strand:+ start:4973 stop:5953 length:981 start_codon:yes stop_codon:yes gene_type:complete
MIKSLNNNILSENLIIDKYLKKLNFDKKGTFNFKNDAAYIHLKKNKKLVVTSDSISENIDFFKDDNPKSIATKIININLSDLSAMGVYPHSYTLNLFLPKYIDNYWLKIFTDELMKIQNKFNFYLLGGDISKSNKLSVSSTFFGFSKSNKIIKQNTMFLNDDVWVTGNIGDSFIGLQLLKRNYNLNLKQKNYFLKKYYYPKACIFGYKFTKYINSSRDISDGFVGDLTKMLDGKYGVKLFLKKIPFSNHAKYLLSKKLFTFNSLLNSGDDYELIFFSNFKYRNNIIRIAKKNKIKISRIGKVVKKLQIIDDSNNPLNIPREFDHFR